MRVDGLVDRPDAEPEARDSIVLVRRPLGLIGDPATMFSKNKRKVS